MKKVMKRISFMFIMSFVLYSCAGTIKTVKYPEYSVTNYKKAYIISTDNSQYIKFKFGIVAPFVYIIPADDPAVEHDVIGTTDAVIKKELEKYGIIAQIGKRDDSPEGFDFIIQYYDTWRWDFKKILDKLEIVFITPEGDKVIAKSTYNIYKNKEFHNFPTPEKEVPKMMKELLSK